MPYDLAAMQAEVIARGFDYITNSGQTARATRWINDAMHEIDRLDRWPYRAASVTGTLPLTISDLGEIERVTNPTNNSDLSPSTRGALLDEFGDLTTTGTPGYFYLVGQALSSLPVTTQPVTVTYWRVSPDLVDGADTPLMPDQFRTAIVERACAKAYRDSDNPDMAAVCKAEADDLVAQMREFYELQTGGNRVLVTFASEDW